jgi:hypothetical protein
MIYSDTTTTSVAALVAAHTLLIWQHFFATEWPFDYEDMVVALATHWCWVVVSYADNQISPPIMLLNIPPLTLTRDEHNDIFMYSVNVLFYLVWSEVDRGYGLVVRWVTTAVNWAFLSHDVLATLYPKSGRQAGCKRQCPVEKKETRRRHTLSN